jgi:ABC-type sugar transport system substrate-binding protein
VVHPKGGEAVLDRRTAVCAVMSFMLFMSLYCPIQGHSEVRQSDNPERVIAFFMPHISTPFMNDLSDAVKRYAATAGFGVIEYVSDNDPIIQMSQIEEAIFIGVDGIILDPASKGEIAPAIRAAKSAGIPLLTLHEQVYNQADCISFIGPDFTDGGTKEMRQAIADFPEGGNFAIVYGVLGHSAQIDISAGYRVALEKSKRENEYKIVFEGDGGWGSEGSMKLVQGWLEADRRIDAIICNNDAMASGALKAVAAAGKAGRIGIYGLDAQDDVLKAIKDGTIRATVFTDYDTEARVSVDIMNKVLAGEPVDSAYMIPMTLITRANVDNFIGE